VFYALLREATAKRRARKAALRRQIDAVAHTLADEAADPAAARREGT
jgi:hypothetical protein